MSESDNFGGDSCDGNDTLRTDAVSETTLRAGSGWFATNVGCGVNSNGNVGRGEGGVSGVSIVCVAGIARLISVVIFLLDFVYCPQMKVREQLV